MNFRHLEVFYAVMINGTVTAAAKQLGVSQPSVTTTLKQAESRLGLQLFQRTRGRLIPTEEAHLLFDEAERAHEALATLSILAKGLELGRGGHVRIASVSTISLELLPDAIERFEEMHTGFQYSVSTLNTEEIIDQLDARKGTFNLGFTFGTQADSTLANTQIGEVGVYAVLPSAWGIPANTEIDLSELADQPYIAGFDHTALGIMSGRMFSDAGVEPNIVARSHTHLLSGALVQRGIGFAILDALTVKWLQASRRSESVVVCPVHKAASLPIVAVHPSARRLSNAASVFIECFKLAFEQMK